jgi:hypothetical protein
MLWLVRRFAICLENAKFYNKHTIFEKNQNNIYANVGIFRIFFLLPLINLEFLPLYLHFLRNYCLCLHTFLYYISRYNY